MLELLKARFSEHKELHSDLEWSEVENRLREAPAAIEVLQKMEESGGEPDTIGYDEKTGKLIFCDCAKESPSGRRSLCYDEKALQRRTKNPPSGSAEQKAKEIGVSMMTEEFYRRLQSLGSFDLKTSSWIATPDDIRSKGGALFCERRYDTVFTFHKSEKNLCTNRFMNVIEQIGRYSCIVLMWLPLIVWQFGFASVFEMVLYMVGNGTLLAAYWISFTIYMKSRTVRLALVLAILPACMFLLSGILLRHWLLVCFVVLFAVGHIYVTYKNNSRLSRRSR